MKHRHSTNTTYITQRHAAKRKGRLLTKVIALAILVIVAGGGYMIYAHNSNKKPLATTTTSNKTTATPSTPTSQTKAATPPPAPNKCASVSGRLIIVSISARHLWACDGTTQSYDSPVVTGMENLAADLTPTGTYHIYSKQTNLSLKGSDSTGSWDDPVSYWEPFLSNQYGVYGFHDATWRKDSDFGNIDPYSSQGSHGCVELPLATAKWIYNWSAVGTTVSIVS